MKKENSIILFHQKKVRRHWDEEQELWCFSIVDSTLLPSFFAPMPF